MKMSLLTTKGKAVAMFIILFTVFIILGITSYAETNFATGSTITITGSHANDTANAASKLKDGLTAANEPTDTNWVKFYGNTGNTVRTIVVDLGVRQYVNSVSMTFFQYLDWGIIFPEQVSFYSSNDKTNWTLLGTVESAIPLTQTGKIRQRYSANGLTSTVRYLKVVVNVDIWVFADELKVNGEQKINLAAGRPVTITGSCIGTPPNTDTPDAATMLVDTQRAQGTNSGDTRWIRFYGNTGYKERTIVVDLGGQYKVSNIIMTFHQNTSWGVTFPTSVTYYVSQDNINWTQAGQINTSIPTNQAGALAQDFHLSNINYTARYVKAVVPVAVWAFSDELQVMGIKTMNLANNAPFVYELGDSVKESTGINDSNPYTGNINDTVYGPTNDLYDGKWDKYVQGHYRSFTIDLKQVCTITKFTMNFGHKKVDGILLPRKVKYSVSQNGTDWSDVGTVVNPVSLTNSNVITQSYTLDGLNYQARYVKATVYTDKWIHVDEFKVWGLPGVINGASVPATTPAPTYPNAYLAPGSAEVGGMKDVVLIYNGYYAADQNIGLNTVEELTPYVGYKNTNGQITDFMFDGFLFLPYGNAPSGGQYIYHTVPNVKPDWDYYLNNLFDQNYNLKALNQAVANVKSTLGNSTYKAKVEIAIPYPWPTQTNFGDVDGDGVSENLTNLADRNKVVKWYVDQVLSRWASANLTHLELVGFYWNEEIANFQASDTEAQCIAYAGNYVRSKGKVLNWIPYHHASGYYEHKTLLGMDGAVMQPNYCFRSWPEAVLDETADTSKKHGMGIEIEIHWDARSDASYRNKYYAYLNHGVTKGYMTDAVHYYYQNGGPGTFYESCNSTNPDFRAIYDSTYQFIKRTYTIR